MTSAVQARFETQVSGDGGPDFPDADQGRPDTHHWSVGVGEQTSAVPPRYETHIYLDGGPNFPDTGQASRDAHDVAVGVGEQITRPVLMDPTLHVLAQAVDDLEGLRKSTANRIAQLTRREADKDGEVRGHGIPENNPSVVSLRLSLVAISEAEKHAVKALEKAMAAHPLGAWVKAQKGLGLKTMARLISAVGDPYWNTLYDRPRKVSELWSYCGLGNAAVQKRAKGQRSNWSAEAKMRAWNCVQPIIKTGGPYREVYDAARALSKGAVYDDRYLDKIGQPIPDGHLHNRAVRAVMKAILKDLWIESRRIHEELSGSGHLSTETRVRPAGAGEPTP